MKNLRKAWNTRKFTNALYDGDWYTVDKMLDKDISMRAIDEGLQYMAYRGATQTLEKSLNKGANLHYNDNMPLISAAHKNHLDAVEILISRGALSSAQNSLSLMFSIQNNNKKMALALVKSGANLHNAKECFLRKVSREDDTPKNRSKNEEIYKRFKNWENELSLPPKTPTPPTP